MSNDDDELRVFGCDLFLLERWDAGSPLSADAQMVQIFEQFVELPIAQRLVYIKRARNLYYASALPEADRGLLARVRPYDERVYSPHSHGDLWLRTYYGPGSDEALQELMADPAADDDKYILSDPTRYNFGSNWQRIFHRMPQLLDVSPKYETRVSRARARCVHAERYDRAMLERDGRWPQDASSKGELYADWHLERQVGYICILDEKTLSTRWQESDDEDGEGGEVGNRSVQETAEGTTTRKEKSYPSKSYAARRILFNSTGRELLSGWYDAHGTLLRWNRLTKDEVFYVHGLLMDRSFDDCAEWLSAHLDRDLPDPGFDTNPVSAADLEDANVSESDGGDSFSEDE